MHPTTTCTFLLFLTLVTVNDALQCYKCGKYQEEGGSILACQKSSFGELVTCRETDKYCMKYVNAGVTVRQCMETCDENTSSGSTQFYCCKEDSCNSGQTLEATFHRPYSTGSIALALTICLWWL